MKPSLLESQTHEAPPGLRRFVEFTLRHGRALWIVALLLAVPATLRTASLYLHLRSELEELLPRKAPSVLAIDELRDRMPGIQHLGVVVDFGKPENAEAAERFIDDLAEHVRAYPPTLARRVRIGNLEEKSFLEKNAPLYLDVQDLETIRARVEARRDWEVSRGTGADLDEDEPAPALDFTDIEKKYDERAGGGSKNRFPGGRFTSKEKHLTLMLIEVGGFTTAQGSNGALLQRVKSDILALGGPDHYAPGMRVGYTGDVAIAVEETSALMEDLSISSIVVLCAVFAVMVLYYRWVRAVVILVVPLLLATVYSFALASLPPFNITELNSNTAFLGSIIVGNGINFGIIELARYMEERRKGNGVKASLLTSVWMSRPATLSAALAAGVSYVSLSITDFRGFRQFGILGGIGMALSWIVAFVLVPPLTSWLDRGKGAVHEEKEKPTSWMAPIARLLGRAPLVFAVLAALATVVFALRVRRFDASELEYDFSKLRRADTWTSGEGYWGGRMDDLLGSYLTPTVILTDSVDEARAVGAAVKEDVKNAPLSEMISTVRTVDDVLPTRQEEKIVLAAAIREDMTPKMQSLVPPDKRELMDRLIANKDLHPITAKDLPETFTAGMRERDGSLGKAVLVFPRPVHALWEGPSIQVFAERLRVLAEKTGARPGRLAGSLPLSADILGSIRRDGVLASASAFGGVILVVLLLFRGRSTAWWVTGSLAVGVLWLAGSSMLLGVRINFANFIAYPITFGIGVDYAVNIMARYVRDGRKDILAAVRTTGGAVVLCSATTVIGYSSLLLAQNRALFLFGLLAVLGEFCCLTTAVVALPAVMLVLGKGRASAAARDEVASEPTGE